MKPYPLFRRAFTLIELLVVIAVIAILAAFLFPVMKTVTANQSKTLARAELNQLATGIEAYKAQYNFYPPDNPTNALTSPLYYELMGTLITNLPGTLAYVTLDGSSTVTTNQLRTSFNVTRLANASASRRGDDDRAAAASFVKDLKPTQIGGGGGPRFFISSVRGDRWRYNSSSPTNNPGSYDLWVDIMIDGKTNRINNWSKDPIIL